jgi:NADH:ubiquinone oxidoreductase subunit 5 (subunit L)/multisubunit Na+/H+ antiporter MnhA subunit
MVADNAPMAAGLCSSLYLKGTSLKGVLALAVSLVAGYLSVSLFSATSQMTVEGGTIIKGCQSLFNLNLSQDASKFLTFTVDGLSKLIVLFICIITTLILIYSLAYNRSVRVSNYYPWFLITLGCSYGAVLLTTLYSSLFWGILGITFTSSFRATGKRVQLP